MFNSEQLQLNDEKILEHTDKFVIPTPENDLVHIRVILPSPNGPQKAMA